MSMYRPTNDGIITQNIFNAAVSTAPVEKVDTEQVSGRKLHYTTHAKVNMIELLLFLIIQKQSNTPRSAVTLKDACHHIPAHTLTLTLSKYSSSPPLWSIRLEGGEEAGRSSRPADS